MIRISQFEKPGRRADFDYPEIAQEALSKALSDARITYDQVEQAAVGYVYGEGISTVMALKNVNVMHPAGDSTCGQRALYQSGMTGIPIYNVNNNCATGSSALHLAYQFVRGGSSDCALALGFEKMEKGSLGSKVRKSHLAFTTRYLIRDC